MVSSGRNDVSILKNLYLAALELEKNGSRVLSEIGAYGQLSVIFEERVEA
jgi:hypothetical protein